MPQLGPGLDTDKFCTGICAPQSDLFVRAINVAGCSAGVFWHLANGQASYFGFHEQEGREARPKDGDFRTWLRTLPANAPINLLRFAAGGHTPILTAAGGIANPVTKGGWIAPGVNNPNLVQHNKTIDFYLFHEGEILVDGMSVRSYVEEKQIRGSSFPKQRS